MVLDTVLLWDVASSVPIFCWCIDHMQEQTHTGITYYVRGVAYQLSFVVASQAVFVANTSLLQLPCQGRVRSYGVERDGKRSRGRELCWNVCILCDMYPSLDVCALSRTDRAHSSMWVVIFLCKYQLCARLQDLHSVVKVCVMLTRARFTQYFCWCKSRKTVRIVVHARWQPQIMYDTFLISILRLGMCRRSSFIRNNGLGSHNWSSLCVSEMCRRSLTHMQSRAG